MKIYLAGPMSGLPEFNFPAFMAKANELRDQGHEVFNPAEHDMEIVGFQFQKGLTGTHEEAANFGLTYRKCLKADLTWICENAEGMYLLKGWENSKGVAAEYALGKALGIQFFYE